jgi:hypothetical protein
VAGDSQGALVLARFAGLLAPSLDGAVFVHEDLPRGAREPRAKESWQRSRWNLADPDHVFVIRAQTFGQEPPCMRLGDGTGLWLRRGDPQAEDAVPYCPAGV